MSCDIIGSWNSEIIGMRFDINTTMTENVQSAKHDHDLDVKLFDHSPPRRTALMDRNWTCSGYTLHTKGGPFYLVATKRKEEVLATFTGNFSINFILIRFFFLFDLKTKKKNKSPRRRLELKR